MHISFLLLPQLILLSVALVFFLYYQLVTRKFTAGAIRAIATVVSNKRYQATKSSIFIPTIAFQDQNGQEITLEAGMSGAGSFSGKSNKPGDTIAILYDKTNPQNFIMDNWRGRYVYTLKRAAITILAVIVIGVLLIFLY